MSKNKFGAYQIGQEVTFNNSVVVILDKFKGNKSNKANRQMGIMTGLKSNPCLYKLSNGFIVRGSTLQKHKQ